MAAKKQTAKKSNTKSTPKKKTNSKSKKPAPKNVKEKTKLSPRIKSLLYFAAALISLLVVFIPGASVWEGIRGFFYGLFGICIILIPILFIYLAVITTLEKEIAHFKTKMAMSITIIMLTETLVYLFSGAQNQYIERGYFTALGRLYMHSGFEQPNRLFSCGGFFSGILGWPLLKAFGWWAATGVVLVLLITLCLIICRISLNDIGRVAMNFGKGVTEAYERQGERRRRRREFPDDEFSYDGYDTPDNAVDYGNNDDFNTSIDIGLGNTKKRRKKKSRSSIDISIDDDSTPKQESSDEAMDKFMDAVKKAQEVNVEPEKKPARSRKPKDEKKEEIFTEEDTYRFPPIGLLKLADNSSVNGDEEMKQNAQKLISTLDSFGVSASITHISRGPSVTRYELHPAPGVKINKITNLSDDIALNLAANGIRIEAPIPGKAAVGIEVPNKAVNVVSIRELIDSEEFETSKSKLTCVLGKDIAGKIITTDIAKLPHLLIAGTTGSGKSVCVNSLLISILYKATPDEVKLVLIDPKMVEFSKYKGVPHLLVPVVSDVKKAAGTLAWAVSEMQDRYKLFAEFDCKDIDSYNKLIDSNLEYMKENPPYENEEGEMIQPVLDVNGLDVRKEKLPRIVIAIDELADLMMTAPGEVEDSIVRLAQLARAAGMHLVIATQRPTANVITGLIKSNGPSRIALKVGSNMDSRIILDTGGAEKLIGRGDMLYMPVGAPNPIRVQGCFATDEEIGGVTRYVKKSAQAQYNEEIEEKILRIAEEGADDNSGEASGDIQVDAKMEEAIKFVCEAGQASTSMLQRRLHVGYARAGRMIDDMEQLGVIGPHQGSKPREVIMTYGEWLERNHNQ